MRNPSLIALLIGHRIRTLRKKKKLTQEKLAELAGIEHKHIQLLESKKPSSARIDTLEKIARAFGMTLAEFFDFEASQEAATRNTYDLIYREYSARHSDIKEVRTQIKRFIQNMKPKAKILDIGCGPGRDAKFFAEQGYKVTGIDTSLKMIQLAETIAPGARFYQMDASRLYFEPETFDGIWANASLLHLSGRKLRAALTEIHTVLRRDGMFYASVKAAPESTEIVEREAYGQERYYQLWNKKDFLRELENAGFEITAFWEEGESPVWLNVLCKKAAA